MRTGLVSVVMPVYNGEIYIRESLESIQTQTYTDWELIVVDDGSTDGTAQVVTEFDDPRIRYVYQPNRGQATALNRGLELAVGEFVTTLDADDKFTTNSLLDRVEYLNRQPNFGAVYGDGYYCDADGKPLMRFSENRIGDVKGQVYSILIASPFFGTGANVLVRREFIETYGIRYDESIVWCQDYDFYIRLAEKVSFGLITTPTVWYRIHDANMTVAMDRRRRLDSLFRTKKKVLASERFQSLSRADRYTFFRAMLLDEFVDWPEYQELVFESDEFGKLSKRQQATLLRNAAMKHIPSDANAQFAMRWMRRSWILYPVAPKSSVALVLAHMNPQVARRVTAGRRRRAEETSATNPFWWRA